MNYISSVAAARGAEAWLILLALTASMSNSNSNIVQVWLAFKMAGMMHLDGSTFRDLLAAIERVDSITQAK